ncbi:hypothetical protein, partial [Streptomyces sp. SID3343]|uniref:hypothetical protein n=1 Tax=Streptomyces sp. SID3343 TaxID=2690260 RepID=UPI00136AC3F0
MGSDHPRAAAAVVPHVDKAVRAASPPTPMRRRIVTPPAVLVDLSIVLVTGTLGLLDYLVPVQRESPDVTPLGILLSVLGAGFLIARRRRP